MEILCSINKINCEMSEKEYNMFGNVKRQKLEKRVFDIYDFWVLCLKKY